jgi:hypothetical protein
MSFGGIYGSTSSAETGLLSDEITRSAWSRSVGDGHEVVLWWFVSDNLRQQQCTPVVWS